MLYALEKVQEQNIKGAVEDSMKRTTLTQGTRIDMGYETSRFVLNVGIWTAALIGTWGLACLIGGLVTNGPAGLLRGFIIAVTGS